MMMMLMIRMAHKCPDLPRRYSCAYGSLKAHAYVSLANAQPALAI